MFVLHAVQRSRSASRSPSCSGGLGSGLLRTLVVLASVSVVGCGTKTTGIEECRQIELARCLSAERCELIEDTGACERYVQDHCRHGFDPSIGPSKSEVNDCSAAIEEVGECAVRSGTKTAPASCRGSRLDDANAKRVCDLVERPERISACSFLSSDKGPRQDAAVAREETETEEPQAETKATEDAGSADGGR